MADDTYYITPHEAALAVVATAMKKARLRLDTLIINSILGGVLFSAGGMLHVVAGSENPGLNSSNPGVVHFMQGMVYPIGLFYVIMMGAELYNSNILYFSVGVSRGAVSILDLLVSWFVSWLFNLLANLFVCFIIIHLSGMDQNENYARGSLEMGYDKLSPPFIQTFIRGCAANFCVCLAVYLQLLCKPIHSKLIVMSLPIFTFVSVGFNHVVADMFIVPNALFVWCFPTDKTRDIINALKEGSGHYDHLMNAKTYIWRTLIPATLGNALGGSVFGVVVVYYLHLVVVERDRKLLNLPTYEAKDEQPELATDSRVVRVSSGPIEGPSESSSTSVDDFEKPENFDPVSYRPTSTSTALRPVSSAVSRRSHRSVTSSLRSPPGVFPVLGMGEPLTREKTIAGSLDLEGENDEDNISSIISDAASYRSRASVLQDIQQNEEAEYSREGGYNARENALGETLKRVVTHHRAPPTDLEQGIDPVQRRSSIGSVITNNSRRFFKSISQKSPATQRELHRHLNRHSITAKAAQAADAIAGIDNYDMRDSLKKPKSAVRRGSNNLRPRSFSKQLPLELSKEESAIDDTMNDTQTTDNQNEKQTET